MIVYICLFVKPYDYDNYFGEEKVLRPAAYSLRASHRDYPATNTEKAAHRLPGNESSSACFQCAYQLGLLRIALCLCNLPSQQSFSDSATCGLQSMYLETITGFTTVCALKRVSVFSHRHDVTAITCHTSAAWQPQDSENILILFVFYFLYRRGSCEELLVFIFYFFYCLCLWSPLTTNLYKSSAPSPVERCLPILSKKRKTLGQRTGQNLSGPKILKIGGGGHAPSSFAYKTLTYIDLLVPTSTSNHPAYSKSSGALCKYGDGVCTAFCCLQDSPIH